MTAVCFTLGVTAGLLIGYWHARALQAERNLARMERDQATYDRDQALYSNVRVFQSKWTPGGVA